MIKLKNLICEVYTAVVLDDESRNKLLSLLKEKIPQGWEVIAHHMTIHPFKGDADERVGQPVILKAEEIGISDKALAIKVSGYDRNTQNSFPHVTIAIDRAGGGKPKDSNAIQNWVKLDSPIELNGTIKNV